MFPHTKEEANQNGDYENQAEDGEHIAIIRKISELKQSKKNDTNYYYLISMQVIKTGGWCRMNLLAQPDGSLVSSSSSPFGQRRWNKLCSELAIPYNESGVDINEVIGAVICVDLKTQNDFQNVADFWRADDYEKGLAAKWEAERSES